MKHLLRICVQNCQVTLGISGRPIDFQWTPRNTQGNPEKYISQISKYRLTFKPRGINRLLQDM